MHPGSYHYVPRPPPELTMRIMLLHGHESHPKSARDRVCGTVANDDETRRTQNTHGTVAGARFRDAEMHVTVED